MCQKCLKMCPKSYRKPPRFSMYRVRPRPRRLPPLARKATRPAKRPRAAFVEIVLSQYTILAVFSTFRVFLIKMCQKVSKLCRKKENTKLCQNVPKSAKMYQNCIRMNQKVPKSTKILSKWYKIVTKLCQNVTKCDKKCLKMNQNVPKCIKNALKCVEKVIKRCQKIIKSRKSIKTY